MTNAELAKVFTEIAELLDFKGENPFRIRSYQQAAKTIEFYPESLKAIYLKGGKNALMDINGIGEAIADKTIELLDTGKLKYFDELKKDVPAIVLQLNQIPGVGTKIAQQIEKELKPKSIEDLKKKLEKLPKDDKGERHIGTLHEKSIAKILLGIETYATLGTRMSIAEAQPIAEHFIEVLRSHADRIDAVGSLRRSRETVGDVDIIAASKEPAKLLKLFTSDPSVSQILAHGDTKAMVLFNGKAHVDLEILPKAEYGSLLQHFTGSKEHNIAMRTYTESLGLSFSEHGFKILKPDHAWAKKQLTLAKKEKRWDAKRGLILCDREEQVYETIGLQWIPPELRENTGELEAAKKGTLPKLIELKDLRGDIHVHSNASGDGREPVEKIVEEAIRRGYEYIGITDHTVGLGVAGKMTNKQLAMHAKKLRKLNDNYKEIRILPGCELNIMADGSLDVPDEILAELDVVVASIHSAFSQSEETMTDRILQAIDNPHVDIIAHPSTRIINYRGEIKANWEKIFARGAQTQTAFEINSYPDRLDLDGLRIRMAKNAGAKFVISTDSHQLKHLDNIRFGVAMARRGWAEKADVLNAQDLTKFLKWLGRS